jgi:Lysozyme like domain
LRKQQHIISFLYRNLGITLLLVVLGAAFFGIAHRIQATQQAQAETALTASSNVQGIIQEVFGPHASAAMSIAQCESNYNPNAVNSIAIGNSHATGLFQILYPSTWYTTSQASNSPFDARTNTLAAYEIFTRDGFSWRQWACQP